jgi:hypothetical protein
MILFDLFMLIFIMWIMIMIVSYFLIFIIGPLHIDIFHNSYDRLITSIVKASSAIGLVVVLNTCVIIKSRIRLHLIF